VGVNAVHPDGKPSKTVFHLRGYDKETNTSVVFCKPLTGRTHQIRVHLQHLGFPIANDPIYNNDPAVNRLSMYKNGEEGESEVFEKNEEEEEENSKTEEDGDASLPTPSPSSTIPSSSDPSSSSPSPPDPSLNNEPLFPPPVKCHDCLNPKPDPLPHEMCLFLHAYIYEGPEWKFETPLPKWAIIEKKEAK